MEKRIEEEFCQAVNRLALTHLPKSAGNFFEKHFGAVLLRDEDEIIAVCGDLDEPRQIIYRLNVKTGYWSMLTVDACGKDMLSFAEYLTGYSAMESGGFLASEFCIFGDEKEDDEVGDEDQEGEDLENAKKPRASFG